MKILISVDIEGVAGVVHPEQTQPGNPEYERARRLMTGEANAAIRGAFEGGATACIVNDSHGGFRNLLRDELDPRAELLLGKPRDLGMMAGVDEACAAVFLVGWHGRAGSAGILAAHDQRLRVRARHRQRQRGRRSGPLWRARRRIRGARRLASRRLRCATQFAY